MDYTRTSEQIWKLIKLNAKRTILYSESELLYFDESLEKNIFEEYERLKYKLKITNFSNEDDIFIDRHKIAACFAGAIMKYEPIKKKEVEVEEKQNTIFYLRNEFLALTSSIDMMYAFNKDKSSNGFVYPHTKNDNYVTWLCYSLHDEKSDDEDFNTLMFANILFLLESYNDIAG